MKKNLLFLSLAFFASTVFVSAQDYTWDLGNDSITFPVSSGFITETTVEGLTIHPGNEKVVNMGQVENKNGKTFEDVFYANRFKFNGGGYSGAGATQLEPTAMMPSQRYLSFNVEGNCTITALGMTGSNSSERRVFVTDGEKLVGTMIFPVTTGDLTKATVSYDGVATKLYMYCNAACNLYYMDVKADILAGVEGNNADKVVSSVTYYDLLGRQVSETTTGTLVKKVVYEDASVETTKVCIQ